MIDERLDRQILALNKRYQDLFYSATNEKKIKVNRYLSNIQSLDIKRIIEDIEYSKYARQHFSVNGNVAGQMRSEIDCSNCRIAVYSCIVGNYDDVIEPVYKEDSIDYFMFTDQDLPESSAWTKINIREFDDYQNLNASQLNRKIKILQTERLLQYDYTIYVDGNIEIVSGVSPMITQMGRCGLGVHFHRGRDCIYDEAVAVKHLKRIDGKDMFDQLDGYRQEGFPRHFGLYENSILIRNNRDSETMELMRAWWEEFCAHPTRDQLSFPYIIWKMGYNKEKICILGNNVERNPRFNRFYNHKNSQ